MRHFFCCTFKHEKFACLKTSDFKEQIMPDFLWGMGMLAGIFQRYGVHCVGVGDKVGGEDDITLTLILYNDDAQRSFDSRMTGEIVFRGNPRMRLCVLYPGSGCAINIEDGVIKYAEDGPKGFADRSGKGLTGKNVLVHAQARELKIVVIVWNQNSKAIPDCDFEQIVRRMLALDRALC